MSKILIEQNATINMVQTIFCTEAFLHANSFAQGVIQKLRGQEEGGRGSVQKSELGHMTKGRYLSCKMSTIVHSRGEGGQNLVKFGPHSY